jgi:membrane-associated phospholipid phosphatase
LKNPGSKQLFHTEDKIAVLSVTAVIILQFYYGLYADVIAPITGTVVLLLLVFFDSLSTNKVLLFFRSYIHIPLYGIAFAAFQTFIHKLNPVDYDTMLAVWDLTVFRFDVTMWLQSYISRGLTEVLTLSYFSYYVLPTLTFLLLFIQKKNENSYSTARWYLLSIVIGWYAAFIFYAIIPAAGPDIAFPMHYTVTLAGLSPITNSYLEHLGKYLRESNIRNTFPSMHFAIILMTNYFAFRFRKKYFVFVTLPLGLMLGIATLYLRQHYLIDLAGSLPMAVISIYAASNFSAETETAIKQTN